MIVFLVWVIFDFLRKFFKSILDLLIYGLVKTHLERDFKLELEILGINFNCNIVKICFCLLILFWVIFMLLAFWTEDNFQKVVIKGFIFFFIFSFHEINNWPLEYIRNFLLSFIGFLFELFVILFYLNKVNFIFIKRFFIKCLFLIVSFRFLKLIKST